MTYNILDFGAKSDGRLSTDAIQSAIDECYKNGGGEVTVPRGRYLVGSIRLRTGVTLHLLEGAVLDGSINPEDYFTYLNDTLEPISESDRASHAPNVNAEGNIPRSVMPYSRWNNAIIRAIGAKNIAIIGESGSEINGHNCYDEEGEEHYRGPHAINMWYCENITLIGYTVCDSGNWAHALQNSKNITVRGITVKGGHDGFDVRSCDNVLVEDSTFLTGDDCIAGYDNIGVVVRDCYLESSASWIRFGGSDVLFDRCRAIAPAAYGFRGSLSDEEKRNRADTTPECRHSCHNVFLYYCDNRAKVRKAPGNIVIRSSYFKNPDTLMRLPFGHKWCCNRSLVDITLENCVIEGIYKPCEITCPPDEPLTLTMKDCVVTPREGYEDIAFITGENIGRVELINTDLKRFTNPEIISTPTPIISVK